jgi:hypothetical protein
MIHSRRSEDSVRRNKFFEKDRGSKSGLNVSGVVRGRSKPVKLRVRWHNKINGLRAPVPKWTEMAELASGVGQYEGGVSGKYCHGSKCLPLELDARSNASKKWSMMLATLRLLAGNAGSNPASVHPNRLYWEV